MLFRFGNFELDEDRRELRLGGDAIPVQPRAFDLLVHLYRQRDRVVSKDELLETLWPGVVVGDGSVQRAVSVVRSALRQGGLEKALRNYSRQGYRLCLDESPAPAPGDRDLPAARAAYEKGSWDTAARLFRAADASAALEAADLEKLADACQCMGQPDDCEPLLERAVIAYSAGGDTRGAARAALRLAELVFEAARLPVARGWLDRARDYLEQVPTGFEHGFEAYVSARIAIATGDPDTAVRHARRGIAIGENIASEDIKALNRMYLGFGLVSLGDMNAGIQLVDKAAATTVSGGVDARTGGIIYCGLIWLCCNRGDWERAAQWSDTFARWCTRTGMTRFTGMCRLHRAEVLSISGDAEEAEREIRQTCEQLSACSPYALGDGYRILGELALLRGQLDEADAAFRRAHDLGFDPQPGLALLQAERGEAEAAIRGLQRSLGEQNWATRQRRGLLLAVLVIIAARHGAEGVAQAGIDELEARQELWTSDFHAAAVARARGEFALLEGRGEDAILAMRQAIRSWQAATATLNLAACRYRLGELLLQGGDAVAAKLELDAARSSFDGMQAPERVRQCDGLLRQLAA